MASRGQPKARKPPTAAARGGAGAGSKGGAKSKSSSSAAHACFAQGCSVRGSTATLTQHYEAVFSTNEKVHARALVEQLSPHFADATSCQICGADAKDSSALLQHVFRAATKTAVGAQAKEESTMHATLFSSFVQELLTMPQVGVEDAVEYLLSLTVPELDDGEDDEDEDEDDEEEYEEDEYDGPADEDELEQFEAFMAAQGIDLTNGMDMDMGMGGGKRGRGGRGAGGPTGGAAEKRAFMRAFMQQMGGGGMDDEDEDEEEEERPRGKKKGAGAGKSSAASGASAAPAGVPAGTNAPGDVQCASCSQMRHKDMYSSAQQKKKGKRRCKFCVDAETGASPSAAAPSAAAGGHGAAAAAGASKASAGAAAAAASSAVAKPASASSSASSTPARGRASSSASAATSTPSAAASHSLHLHHATRHVMSTGEEIVSEDEEFDGDGLPHSDSEEDDEEEDEDDEDESEDDMDPLAALFGGGRRRRRPHQRAGRSAKGHPRISLSLVHERPGQQLRRDRRLRLKPSADAPVRSWLPRHGEATCGECEWRTAGRLVRGWTLACTRCAQTDAWIDDGGDEDEDEEDEEAHAHARRARLSLAPRVSAHASTYPTYRPGVAACVRSSCGSTRMLLVYDEAGDEFIVCAACVQSKQKLRYYDSSNQTLVNALQEPVTHD